MSGHRSVLIYHNVHDPSTESYESRHTKRYPLEHLDPVIAAFYISVGIWIFEGIEDLNAPVLIGERYLNHVFEAAPLSAHNPPAQTLCSFFSACTCFDIFKLLFQSICLIQRLGYAEYIVELDPVLDSEFICILQEQIFAPFEISPPLVGQSFLFLHAYSFDGIGYLADIVILVDNDLRLRKQLVFSGWKDIHDPAVLRIGQDALELLAFGIALELIDRKDFRQFPHPEVDLIYDLCSRWRGHIVVCGDSLDAAALLQLPQDLQEYPVRELTAARKEVDVFIEPFTAVGTDMTAFS